MSRAILKEIEACTNGTIARMANNTTATLNTTELSAVQSCQFLRKYEKKKKRAGRGSWLPGL